MSARAPDVRKCRAPAEERELRVLTGREIGVPREGAICEAEVALGSAVVHNTKQSLMGDEVGIWRSLTTGNE